MDFRTKTNKDLFKAVEAFSKKIHCDINPQTDVDKSVNEMLFFHREENFKKANGL